MSSFSTLIANMAVGLDQISAYFVYLYRELNDSQAFGPTFI